MNKISNGELAQMEAAGKKYYPHENLEALRKEEYVLLPLSDYTKLKKIAELNLKESKTVLALSDILFLASVCAVLKQQDEYTVTLYLTGTTGTITVSNGRYDLINSSFDLSLCSKYYNRAQKFIDEIL